jgi:hypothetical protein
MDDHIVYVDSNNIQVICDWLAPLTLTNIHGLLGLANFYPNFVLRLSHITFPLRQVTKGGTNAKFIWA